MTRHGGQATDRTDWETHSLPPVCWRHRDRKLEIAFLVCHASSVSKVEQLTAELEKLSESELSRIRDWLDNVLEDQWEFTPEFEAAIQRSEQDRAQGRHTRVRKPQAG